MALINRNRLEQYLKLNYNVLFIGEHGVGKTMIVREAVERAKLSYLFMSASTLDPWVDFVGVPRIVEQNGHFTLELVRPKLLETVEFIFLDEFNRAPDKVINAAMELIQFKSINGYRFPNLRVIWAAINPEDDADTYSVNHLDPAHLDRFHVHLKVPYKVDEEYFKSKYPDVASIFTDWWNDLPLDIKKMVSPRRLEYVIDAYQQGCRIEDFIPPESNPKKLRSSLQSIPFAKSLETIVDQVSAETFLRDPNNTLKLLDLVKVGNANAIAFFNKFGQPLPKELVEPFIEAIAAKKSGLEIVASLRDLVIALPGDKGNSGTAALINNADLVGMCARKSTTLEMEVADLNNREAHTLKKLAGKMVDVIFTCNTSTLMRIFWGLLGKEGGSPTNFARLLEIFGKLNHSSSVFSPKQVSILNQKLHDKRIVDTTRFV